MYTETIDKFAELGRNKRRLLKRSPQAFFVGAMMAGAYIGLGIVLIFSVASNVQPEWQKLTMGVSFGIALTLVVFAGAELFTGHTMYMTLSCLRKKTTIKDLLVVWGASWSFNLIGSIGFALLFVLGGGGALFSEGLELLNKIATYKMNSDGLSLFARGVMCNWLVCLALWMAAKTQSDSGKAIVISWCLFAFIASGFEHCVANMTLFSISLLGSPTEAMSMQGVMHNLLWVTLGNIIGGSLFMAVGYWLASGSPGKKDRKTKV